MSHDTHGLQEFQAEAARFAGTLKPHGGGATIVALSGDLGAGKTTFVQSIAHAFGIEVPVASPTYVIEKVYEPQMGEFKRIIHIDAYRLEKSHDLEALGWKEIAADTQNLILIEWPERVPELVTPGSYRVELTYIDENTRAITYA